LRHDGDTGFLRGDVDEDFFHGGEKSVGESAEYAPAPPKAFRNGKQKNAAIAGRIGIVRIKRF
jgi:hypothetical protein